MNTLQSELNPAKRRLLSVYGLFAMNAVFNAPVNTYSHIDKAARHFLVLSALFPRRL